jgi:DeoR/GlpR family transcriptional regulator of sugar metabolism
MLGGRLFRHSMFNVGAAVIDAASRLRADIYFMGVTGVHPDAGLSTGDAEEAAVKRALHERAAETVVLASAEKLMAASPFLVAAFAELGLLVVPQTLTGIVRARCARAVSRFRFAPPPLGGKPRSR